MSSRFQLVRDIGLRRLSIAVLLLIALISASVAGYVASRESTNQETSFGDQDSRNHVNVTVWITRVDAMTQTLSVTVMNIRPVGTVADPNDASAFAEDTRVMTDAVGTWSADIKAGDAAPDIEQRVAITGTATDYPFDRYVGHLEVHASGPNGEIPVVLTVLNTDPFFGMSNSEVPPQTSTNGAAVDFSISRSLPTLIFATFVMVLMLGLALGAVVAAFYVLHWRRGLIFPACSMMAAILFALIPLRNAVPGNPPIGSVIDFGSFFIAEAVISIALISSIVMGFRHQRTLERAEDEAEPATVAVETAFVQQSQPPRPGP